MCVRSGICRSERVTHARCHCGIDDDARSARGRLRDAKSDQAHLHVDVNLFWHKMGPRQT